MLFSFSSLFAVYSGVLTVRRALDLGGSVAHISPKLTLAGSSGSQEWLSIVLVTALALRADLRMPKSRAPLDRVLRRHGKKETAAAALQIETRRERTQIDNAA